MRYDPKSAAHRPLTREQQDLVVQWLPLAHKKVNDFARSKRLIADHPVRDELDSCAHLALVKAAQAWKPHLMKFQTYFGSILDRDLPKCLARFLDNQLSVASLDNYASMQEDKVHWDASRWSEVSSIIASECCELAAQVGELHAEGHSCHTIAKMLGAPIGNVRAALREIRSSPALRQRLAAVLQ